MKRNRNIDNSYEDAFKRSINDPNSFWAKAAEDCHWYRKWDKVLDDSRSCHCYACLCSHRCGSLSKIEGRDLDWNDVMANAEPHDCVPLTATDPLYILYTSGTTGQPKGVVRDNGGHVVALKWTMKNIYNVDAGDL